MPSYQVQRTLEYTPEQLFDIAADVERYPEFLPGWIAVRVRRSETDGYSTDQLIGFDLVRARFQSRTLLQRPERIDVTSTDRMFRRFQLAWRFEPLSVAGCRVTLMVELELRSKPVRVLFGQALSASFGSTMSAFEARARRLYGPSDGQSLDSTANITGSPSPSPDTPRSPRADVKS